ncbi:MAG TPA: CehA/McbA family metallohydrolase [Verrucomicrobiales bacterium]|nr:CehA/McbA family metallohydrolase [Verrucomicrobiales bacterium]
MLPQFLLNFVPAGKAAAALLLAALLSRPDACAAELPVASVEGQPLAANIRRLTRSLDFLGQPFDPGTAVALKQAARQRDAALLQQLLDPLTLFSISINPELRVKLARGPALAEIQQAGYTAVLFKVFNEAASTASLHFSSPESGPVYAGASRSILQRQAQSGLLENENHEQSQERFFDIEVFKSSPMTAELSGLEVEYGIALLSSSEAGKREVTIIASAGPGSQDLGFRNELPILLHVRPAVAVRLEIREPDGTTSTARLEFRDRLGKVYPPQAKRVAPDLFFQPQIYRQDGQTVLLPPGDLELRSSRGPEYRVRTETVSIPSAGDPVLPIGLERWVDPAEYGFYSGDHHIHAAGCSHYTSPTEGVGPEDMFLQVLGEGLHVGCVLTWGPCFDFQRQFFSPSAHELSRPFALLKYDLEISGFGSAALGHVCLLNLSDQTYPGSEGSSQKGWPTWTVPVMRWCKEQGGVTGYPHSAMAVDPPAEAARLLRQFDSDADGLLGPLEIGGQLLPYEFSAIDRDRNGMLAAPELQEAASRAAGELPHYSVPAMNGAGAMEIFVSAVEGVCDFISAMDTARVAEWNTWYHLMNCGFPIKLSGETDFPCMSSRRVGQGRVYVQLGKIDAIDFSAWCAGLAAGRSYVSDGYAHALAFTVNGIPPGPEALHLDNPASVVVEALVAFAAEIPEAVAHGTAEPPQGRRMTGDTIELHLPRSDQTVAPSEHLVEIVVNGSAVDAARVPGDGLSHPLRFEIPVECSSWIALRQFPQLHSNPVTILVGDQALRASRRSALWCAESTRLLWENRHGFIAEEEREEARASYDRAIAAYERIAAECPEGS